MQAQGGATSPWLSISKSRALSLHTEMYCRGRVEHPESGGLIRGRALLGGGGWGWGPGSGPHSQTIFHIYHLEATEILSVWSRLRSRSLTFGFLCDVDLVWLFICCYHHQLHPVGSCCGEKEETLFQTNTESVWDWYETLVWYLVV